MNVVALKNSRFSMRLLLLFNAVASMAIASNNIGDWDWDLKDLSANDLFSDDSALDYLSDDSFVSGLLDKTNIDAFGQLQNEPTINASGHLDEANSDASRTLLDEPTIHALGQVPDEPITDDASGRLPYESPSGAFGQFLENPTIDPPDPSLENPNIHLISDSTTTTKNEAEGSPIILKPSIEGNPKPETQIARTSTCDDYFGLACCTGEAVHSPGSSEPRPSDSLQDISGCSGCM